MGYRVYERGEREEEGNKSQWHNQDIVNLFKLLLLMALTPKLTPHRVDCHLRCVAMRGRQANNLVDPSIMNDNDSSATLGGHSFTCFGGFGRYADLQ